MKKLIIGLSVAGIVSLGVYGYAFANTMNAVREATPVLKSAQNSSVQVPPEAPQASPEIAPTAETDNVPVVQQSTPETAETAAPAVEPAVPQEPAAMNCDPANLGAWERYMAETGVDRTQELKQTKRACGYSDTTKFN